MANPPVPTPALISAGAYITGAMWRANVSDVLAFNLNRPVFLGTQTISQSAVVGWTPGALDTEQIDTYGGHSLTGNTSQYVAQIPGWYNVAGVAVFAAGNTTGVRAARIQVNGTFVAGTAGFCAPSDTSHATGVMTPMRSVYLNAGDYLEVAVGQTTTGAISTGIFTDLATSLFAAWCHA